MANQSIGRRHMQVLNLESCFCCSSTITIVESHCFVHGQQKKRTQICA